MMPHGQVVLLIKGIVFPIVVLATAQVGDRVLYQGEDLPLHSNPLEQYFAQGHQKPDALSRGVLSTSCWRGYVATWELRDQKLYLEKVEIAYMKKGSEGEGEIEWRRLPLTVLFPMSTAPVHASWYSGTVRIPRGRVLRYVNIDYASIYEKEILVRISKGVIERTDEIDNTSSPALQDPERERWDSGNVTAAGGLDPILGDGDDADFDEKMKHISPPEAVEQPSCRIYEVQKGDDIYSLGMIWAVSPSRLREVNKLTDDELVPGQRLIIPLYDQVTNTDSGGSSAAEPTRDRP